MNRVVPFTLNNAQVKGRVLKLDQELDFIIKQHQYPDLISQVLAELLIVCSLIGSQFKEEMLLTLQLQIKDKTEYLVADYQHPGKLRGYARCNEPSNDDTYESIIKNSILIVTIDRPNSNRYQGIIEVSQDSIGLALEEYFQMSEQIDTILKVKVGKLLKSNQAESWCGGGMMLQRLPSEQYNDTWQEARIFFATLKDDELIDPDLTTEKLIYSLFNEMEIKVFSDLAIIHQCRCSREKIEFVIASLGKEEASLAIKEDKITVNCEFCNKKYEFTSNEVEKIFAEEE
jgi:molecular chaperone Hsp33